MHVYTVNYANNRKSRLETFLRKIIPVGGTWFLLFDKESLLECARNVFPFFVEARD